MSLLSLVDSEENLKHISLLKDFVDPIRCVVRPSTTKKRVLQALSMLRFRPYSIRHNDCIELRTALDTLLSENTYDVVLCESVLIASYCLSSGVRCVIDQHNIEYELLWRTFRNASVGLRKFYSWWEAHALQPVEIELCKRAELVLVTSEPDGQILKRDLPLTPIKVVPNGVDLEIAHYASVEQISGQIIFAGAMNYYPNADAAIFFAKQIWPLIRAQMPEATWLIVGREPPPEVKRLGNLPGVTVTGTVSEVRPYLAASAVAIVPLQVGSGTRLKILEAFAMRKAVVSTSVGCEGLAVVPGQHLLLADRPAEFAQAVITLLKDTEMCSRLGSAGRALVESQYSWDACGDRLLEALEKTLQERKQLCQ